MKERISHDNIEKFWLDNIVSLNQYTKWFFSHIERYIGDYVWEVGSGIGTYSKFLLNKNQIILSDIVDEYLERLRDNFRKYNNVKVLKIDLLNDSHYQLIRQYRIDTILCINVLEHVRNDLKAIKFMYRVLQKDGIFIFVGPNHKFLYNSLDKYTNHYRRYSVRQIKNFFNKLGFAIDKIFSFNALGVLSWFWYGSVLKRKVIPLESLRYSNRVIPLVKIIDLVNPFKFGLNIVVIARKK